MGLYLLLLFRVSIVPLLPVAFGHRASQAICMALDSAGSFRVSELPLNPRNRVQLFSNFESSIAKLNHSARDSCHGVV